jgi:hypothetical protein
VDWLYVAGGITVLLWGVWLFADFAADALAGWFAERVRHD